MIQYSINIEVEMIYSGLTKDFTNIVNCEDSHQVISNETRGRDSYDKSLKIYCQEHHSRSP